MVKNKNLGSSKKNKKKTVKKGNARGGKGGKSSGWKVVKHPELKDKNFDIFVDDL